MQRTLFKGLAMRQKKLLTKKKSQLMPLAIQIDWRSHLTSLGRKMLKTFQSKLWVLAPILPIRLWFMVRIKGHQVILKKVK